MPTRAVEPLGEKEREGGGKKGKKRKNQVLKAVNNKKINNT
jgi:hypothetical protein